MNETEVIKKELNALQIDYYKVKANLDKRIYDLEQQTKLFLQLANEVKELKDARQRQIQLNSELLEILNLLDTKPKKVSFISRLFK